MVLVEADLAFVELTDAGLHGLELRLRVLRAGAGLVDLIGEPRPTGSPSQRPRQPRRPACPGRRPRLGAARCRGAARVPSQCVRSRSPFRPAPTTGTTSAAHFRRARSGSPPPVHALTARPKPRPAARTPHRAPDEARPPHRP